MALPDQLLQLNLQPLEKEVGGVAVKITRKERQIGPPLHVSPFSPIVKEGDKVQRHSVNC